MHPHAISHGATKNEIEHRHDICAVGGWLHERGFAVATDGNISLRLGPDRVLASPTCMSKAMMTPDDLVVTDLQGNQLSGTRRPSSELGMHLLIYRLRPDVNAVCHAHPPIATGHAAAGIALDRPILCELVMGLGRIPLAHFGTPGTPELAEALAPLVPDHDAILMANHGVVTYGEDLLTAFLRMETAEHCAHVSLVTEILGKQQLLSDSHVQKLFGARARYRNGSQPASSHLGDLPAQPDRSVDDRAANARRKLDAPTEETPEKNRSRLRPADNPPRRSRRSTIPIR